MAQGIQALNVEYDDVIEMIRASEQGYKCWELKFESLGTKYDESLAVNGTA